MRDKICGFCDVHGVVSLCHSCGVELCLRCTRYHLTTKLRHHNIWQYVRADNSTTGRIITSDIQSKEVHGKCNMYSTPRAPYYLRYLKVSSLHCSLIVGIFDVCVPCMSWSNCIIRKQMILGLPLKEYQVENLQTSDEPKNLLPQILPLQILPQKEAKEDTEKSRMKQKSHTNRAIQGSKNCKFHCNAKKVIFV